MLAELPLDDDPENQLGPFELLELFDPLVLPLPLFEPLVPLLPLELDELLDVPLVPLVVVDDEDGAKMLVSDDQALVSGEADRATRRPVAPHTLPNSSSDAAATVQRAPREMAWRWAGVRLPVPLWAATAARFEGDGAGTPASESVTSPTGRALQLKT